MENSFDMKVPPVDGEQETQILLTQRPVALYKVAGRSLRKTDQRDRNFVAEKKVNSSKTKWPKRQKLSQRRRRQAGQGVGSRSNLQARNKATVWTGEGKPSHSGGHLPAPEDEFLEDMLSEQPRYQSNSQAKPMEFWEKAAADLPEYCGPWRPSVKVVAPEDFDFYS